MQLIRYAGAVFLLLSVVATPATAGSRKSFNKSVKQGEYVFDVQSRTAVGVDVQIVTVTARRGGRKIAGTKADCDHLPQSAQAVDLNGDGRPELILFGRTAGGTTADTVDIYWLDGNTLRRSSIPDLEEKNGYRGGDRFHLEGKLVVRTVPVYADGDATGKPSGGTRSLKYEFRGDSPALYIQTENSADPERRAPPVAPGAVPPQSAAAEPGAAISTPVSVVEISASDDGIDIRSTAPIAKFRTVRLDKPERIAIDIAGAISDLAGKKIAIGRFGISAVRVGSNKGFLRIVLDTDRKNFPTFEAVLSGQGVRITFPQ